jgi:hypothetical protein
MLLALLATKAGIGHAHDAAASPDACAVCVHARTLALTPAAQIAIAPTEVEFAIAPVCAVAASHQAPLRRCGRAPPVLRAGFR